MSPSKLLGAMSEPYKIMSTEIIWQGKSVRVQAGIQGLVDMTLGADFYKYVSVAMRREITKNGAKTVVTAKGKEVNAKEFGPTQRTGLSGDRYTTGHKEQWLLHCCGQWCRQLAATDEAFATLEKAGMLGSTFEPIPGSALACHLAFLKDAFLRERQPEVKPEEQKA